MVRVINTGLRKNDFRNHATACNYNLQGSPCCVSSLVLLHTMYLNSFHHLCRVWTLACVVSSGEVRTHPRTHSSRERGVDRRSGSVCIIGMFNSE